MKISSISLFAVVLFVSAQALPANPADTLPPDIRVKADVLLVVGHPDDETAVTAYLAQLLDQHKRVEVVYMTHGEAGHNNMGSERATALGAVRETEVRHSLATLGIDNVWFLDGLDTPGQNVLQSLSRWGNGRALEEVVRMVRLTRPEAIITWLPGFFIGENHGDHQAAGVLATEAFDMAGDPAVFPAQLAGAVRLNETQLEGLQPWQSKKIYYFSDASDQAQFKDTGPLYPTTAISPTHNLPYWQMAMNAFCFHLTQYRSYIEKLKQRSPGEQQSDWGDPVQLTFGKSNVGGNRSSDVFDGIGSAPIAFVRQPAPVPPPVPTLALGGPWGFYEVFHREHGLDSLPRAAVPEIAITRGAELQIPLVLHNTEDVARTVNLTVSVPKNWTVESPSSLSLQPGSVLSVLVTATSPSAEDKAIQEITCRAESGGQSLGVVQLHVRLRSGGLPQ